MRSSLVNQVVVTFSLLADGTWILQYSNGGNLICWCYLEECELSLLVGSKGWLRYATDLNDPGVASSQLISHVPRIPVMISKRWFQECCTWYEIHATGRILKVWAFQRYQTATKRSFELAVTRFCKNLTRAKVCLLVKIRKTSLLSQQIGWKLAVYHATNMVVGQGHALISGCFVVCWVGCRLWS